MNEIFKKSVNFINYADFTMKKCMGLNFLSPIYYFEFLEYGKISILLTHLDFTFDLDF